MTLYTCVSHWLLGPILRKLYVINVYGAENLPLEGGLVVAINHQHGVDPFVAGVSLQRQLAYAAKEDLFENPLWRFGLKRVGAYPVPRGGTGTQVKEYIERSTNQARGGSAVGVFPEGSRSRDGMIHRPERGTAVIAIRSGCPISPVGMVYTRPAPPKNPTRLKRLRYRLTRTWIDIYVGKPLHFPQLDERIPIPSSMIIEVRESLVAEWKRLTRLPYSDVPARSVKSVK